MATSRAERLLWEQPASAERLLSAERFRFLLYVDGAPQELDGVECVAGAGALYSCSAPLPALAPGAHVLQLASVADGLQSAPSEALEIGVASPFAATLASIQDPAAARVVRGRSELTAPVCIAAACYVPSELASSAGRITSPIALGDGRLMYVEHERAVRLLTSGEVTPGPLLTVGGDGARVIALAVGPEFPQSRAVFVAIATIQPTGRSLSVMRLREAGNQLAQPAVIVADLPLPDEGDPLMAVDAAGALLLAMPVWPHRRSDPYSGALLRFSADGTVPRDVGQLSPVVATGIAASAGLTADAANRVWWLRAGSDTYELSSLVVSPGLPLQHQSRWTSAGAARAEAGANGLAPVHSARGLTAFIFADADGRLLHVPIDAAATPQPVDVGAPVTALGSSFDEGFIIVVRSTSGSYSLLKLTPLP